MRIINDLKNDDYHNSEEFKRFWSSTNIVEYTTSPKRAYFNKFLAEKKEPSEALIFGNKFHTFIEFKGNLSDFFKHYELFEPPVNKATGEAYGNSSKAFKDSANALSRPPVTQSEIDQLTQMLDSFTHTYSKFAKSCFAGNKEVSIFDEALMLKIRADVFTENKIVDYKTISSDNFNLKGIRNDIIKYKYDIKAAMYQFVMQKITGEFLPFFWVFIEKTAPFDSLVVSADNFAYSITKDVIVQNSGAYNFEKLLDIHLRCVNEQSWPGLCSFIEPDIFGNRFANPDKFNDSQIFNIY